MSTVIETGFASRNAHSIFKCVLSLPLVLSVTPFINTDWGWGPLGMEGPLSDTLQPLPPLKYNEHINTNKSMQIYKDKDLMNKCKF